MTDVPSLVFLLDAVEAAAYSDLFAAVPPGLKASLGMELHEIGGARLLIASAVPSAMFNRVIGLGNSEPASDEIIDDVCEYYARAGVQNWWIHVSPGSRPPDLADRLASRGFTLPQRRGWVKMLRGAEPPAPVKTGLEVRIVKPDEATACAEVICSAFEMPGDWAPLFAQAAHRDAWQVVAAVENARIVGGGMLYVEGDTAWLGSGGVLPESRGQHAHRALMTLRIELAIKAGCRHIITETGEPIGDESNPSLRNMEACGFSRLFTRQNFAAPVPSDKGAN